jgi:hypothetical protein
VATTPDRRPVWTLPSGVPPAQLVRAALRSGSLIDAYGSRVPAARTAYLLYPSDALYPPEDLRLGERLLLDCGLLLREDDLLYPTDELKSLLALEEAEASSLLFERAVFATMDLGFDLGFDGALPPDARLVAEGLISDLDRREATLLALGRKHDESLRAALGLQGEEFVAEHARDELTDLGLEDLADGVRCLSEVSDQLGYDVVAPRVGGKRRLEVKTSARGSEGLFHFYLSRGEVDVGLRDEDWALVACEMQVGGGLRLIGWCRASALDPYLPMDAEGARWMSAELTLPATLFNPGLPPAV